MERKRLHVRYVRSRKLKRIALVIVIILFFAALIHIAKLGQFYNKIYTGKRSSEDVTKIPAEKKVFTFLLMGYGGPGHDGAYLTDTMMVVRADLLNKKVLLLSVPRDIYVKVPTKSGADFHSKINAVYQMGLFPKNYPDIPDKYRGNQGAGDLVKAVVGAVTGIPIDYYVTVDFGGFKKAVDILGGVDITVATAFDDYEYPIDGHETDLCGKTEEDLPELEKIATESPELAFPCRYEHLHFNAGLQHMDAETALKYVRSRHSEVDGGDFGRANRQQLFLEGVKDKVISIGFIPKVIPLLDELGNNMRTDTPLEIVNKMLGQAPKAGDYTVSQLVLADKQYIKQGYSADHQYILMPTAGIDQWKAVKQWIANTIEGITPAGQSPLGGASPSLVPSQSQKLRQ